MAVHGYVTHAARNRRFTALLVLGYVVAFELIGAFVLTMLLLIVDQEHTILSNPIGYALRYRLPVAIFSAVLFRRLYRGHADAVMHGLGVQIVSRADEPRFVAIRQRAQTINAIRWHMAEYPIAVATVILRQCDEVLADRLLIIGPAWPLRYFYRGFPSTRQILLSDIGGSRRTRSIQHRRRAGRKVFPAVPPAKPVLPRSRPRSPGVAACLFISRYFTRRTRLAFSRLLLAVAVNRSAR